VTGNDPLEPVDAQIGNDSDSGPSKSGIAYARRLRVQPKGIGFVAHSSQIDVRLATELPVEHVSPESRDDTVGKRFVAQQGGQLATNGETDRHM
jgi:hypothetical protein